MARTAATLLLSLLLIGGTGGHDISITLSSSSSSVVSTTRLPVTRDNIPPLITLDPPKDVQFREQKAIELPCAASGVPMPNYRWTFDGAPFDLRGNDGRIALKPGVGTLVFNRTLARDEGYYQCQAYNALGTAMSVKVSLRQAILEPFPASDPTKPQWNVVNLGSSLTLRCTPPRSFPKADVFWAILADRGFTPVDYSDRITQDPSGNLQFVNVQAEDGKNGSTYACIATNTVMRGFQQGEYNTIVVQGATIRHYPPQIMWQSPTQQIALRGQTLSIKCIFAGSPTPNVTWVRTDGILPADARLESFGQTLTFDNVQFADNGSYECQGINDNAIAPLRRSFTLTVESAPYWVEKPVSVDVAENDTARFACRAEGIPEPTYFWFINGIPLRELPADPRRNATTNYIVFSNVTVADSQVIQCNVTNKYGYIFTNAYLNVNSNRVMRNVCQKWTIMLAMLLGLSVTGT